MVNKVLEHEISEYIFKIYFMRFYPSLSSLMIFIKKKLKMRPANLKNIILTHIIFK